MLSLPASERRHLRGEEKKAFQENVLSFADLHPHVERPSKEYTFAI